MAFDILYFDGHDLRAIDQEDRRRMFDDLVPADAEGGIRLSRTPREALEQACTKLGVGMSIGVPTIRGSALSSAAMQVCISLALR
jgi:hypothetical protein